MLALPAATRAALATIPLPADEPALHALFLHQPHAFEGALPSDDGMTALKLLLHWLPEMRARYDALGIPENVWQDNVKDISLWCADFTAKTSRPGIQEWPWAARSLRLELFRLGRLQFEPTVLEEAVILRGQTFPAGTPVLSVHIPAGEPLDEEAVKTSFRQAEDFFPRHFGTSYPLYICRSWLMAPTLKALLPPRSRILQFQAMFDVLEECPRRQAEMRVFGFLSDNPQNYPESTSLQRTLKAHLLAGGQAMSASAARLWQQP